MTQHATGASFASILPLGAIIQTFEVGGINIVQGFPRQELYEQHNSPYFGETIGRVANRISNARIDNLNGRSYQLPANDGPNTLHGGLKGFGKKLWSGPRQLTREGKQVLEYELTSADGEEGFPGAIVAKIWYTQSGEANENGDLVTTLDIEYEATLVDSPAGIEETVVNLTNHSYFNLSGGESIDGTEVSLSTNLYLPVNESQIPLGTIEPFLGVEAGKVFKLGESDPKFDHSFIVDDNPASVPIDTRQRTLQKLVTFFHPESRVHLEVHSTEPSFQFYTGDGIDVPAVNGAPARGQRAGFAVEPSRYVNAVNTGDWRNMVVLRKGEKYGSHIVYRAWRDHQAGQQG